MKITFTDIGNFLSFYDAIKDNNFSFSTGYKLQKLYNLLQDEYKFFTDSLNKIIAEYGEQDEHGYVCTEDGNIKIKEDKIQECLSKVDELNAMEIDIPNCEFDISEFDKVEVNMNIMNGIIPFIKKETSN